MNLKIITIYEQITKENYEIIRNSLKDPIICGGIRITVPRVRDSKINIYHIQTEKGEATVIIENDKNSPQVSYTGKEDAVNLAKNTLEDIIKKSRVII